MYFQNKYTVNCAPSDGHLPIAGRRVPCCRVQKREEGRKERLISSRSHFGRRKEKCNGGISWGPGGGGGGGRSPAAAAAAASLFANAPARKTQSPPSSSSSFSRLRLAAKRACNSAYFYSFFCRRKSVFKKYITRTSGYSVCCRMTKREKYSYIPPTYKWGKFKILRLPSRSFDLSIKNLSHHFFFLTQSGRQGRKDLYFKFRRGEKWGKIKRDRKCVRFQERFFFFHSGVLFLRWKWRHFHSFVWIPPKVQLPIKIDGLGFFIISGSYHSCKQVC